MFIEANTEALQTVCKLTARQAPHGGDCLASDACLKGFLMIYLMRPNDRQSLEEAASRKTRRFYLYQIGKLFSFFQYRKLKTNRWGSLRVLWTALDLLTPSLLTGVCSQTARWQRTLPSPFWSPQILSIPVPSAMSSYPQTCSCLLIFLSCCTLQGESLDHCALQLLDAPENDLKLTWTSWETKTYSVIQKANSFFLQHLACLHSFDYHSCCKRVEYKK